MKKLLIFSLLISALTTMFMSSASAQRGSERGGVQQRTCVNYDESFTVVAYDKRQFDCADLGTLTVKEINAKGWRVVQIVATESICTDLSVASRYGAGKVYTCGYSWTLLIEK